MIPFSKAYQNEIRDMVQTSFYQNNNIKIIETKDWLTPADFADSSHPNDAGHVVIAQKLSMIIKNYL